ncbi:MAG: YdcF family protein [Rhizomicrobium sp.]
MFFFFSKILVPFERPGDLLLILLVAGTVLSWFKARRKTGICLTSAAVLMLCVVALSPLSKLMTAPLENRFASPRHLPAHVDGIIVLGGGIDTRASVERGRPTLNADAERLTEFARLARAYPTAALVFSGGNGNLFARGRTTEAMVARRFFKNQGLDVRRIKFEGRSRSTYENAIFSKRLVQPRPGDVWLLIASALQIPRAVGSFHKAGWPVTAVPVAYRTSRTSSSYDLALNLLAVDASTHEWIGLLAYRLTGKTDRLFPSPSDP